MPTKKNNNSNEFKQFAIGTKIEHNGKLYEVVQGKFCNDCSIASICSSNDITAGSRIGDVISRNTRIGIFGECSSNNRDDNTSVVFIEVPKNDSKDEYYKISPFWVDDNSIKLKPIKFDLPNGYMIDKDHSDLDKGIIRFKSKWLSLEQMYNMAKATNYHTYLSEIKDSTGDKTYTVREKLIAIANLMDIARYFNGGWEYDVTEEVVGYSIAYYKFVEESHYSVCKLDNSVYTYYGTPVFKNEADAQYVIDNPNFRDVLDNIFKV